MLRTVCYGPVGTPAHTQHSTHDITDTSTSQSASGDSTSCCDLPGAPTLQHHAARLRTVLAQLSDTAANDNTVSVSPQHADTATALSDTATGAPAASDTFIDTAQLAGVISLRVSGDMLQGGTGCSDWEAGYVLSELLINRPELVRGKVSAHTRTQTHTHAHRHTRTHARTHTHTHTHTHRRMAHTQASDRASARQHARRVTNECMMQHAYSTHRRPFPMCFRRVRDASVCSLSVLRGPVLRAGLRCIELGSGCGTVGITAARVGASHVLMTDSGDEGAMSNCVVNCRLNGLRVERLGGTSAGPGRQVCVVRTGCMVY